MLAYLINAIVRISGMMSARRLLKQLMDKVQIVVPMKVDELWGSALAAVVRFLDEESLLYTTSFKAIKYRLELLNRATMKHIEHVQNAQLIVLKNALPCGTWSASKSLLLFNKVTLDSIGNAFGRSEVARTTIRCDGQEYSIDLSSVRLADIHAALISREMSHINRRHVAGLMFLSYFSIGLMFSPLHLPLYCKQVAEALFIQHCEFKADEDSMIMLKSAGYNPLGILWLLEHQKRWEREQPWPWRMLIATHHPASPAFRQVNLLQHQVIQLCSVPRGSDLIRISNF
jgi:hypothetical protein